MIGYEFFKYKNLVFRKHMGAIIPISLPHEILDISYKDAYTILKKHSGFFIRWEDNFNAAHENNWWHIIKDDQININNYSSNTRSKIRRGLRRFDIIQVEKTEILKKGYQIYAEVFDQYKTIEKKLNLDQFVTAINSLPNNTEFYAIYDKESKEMVGFVENYISSMAMFIVSIWIKPWALQKYANYALVYKMIIDYLEERSFRYISDGARSVSHDTEIHEFLISKFKFRKAYAHMHIAYSPLLRLGINLFYPFRSIFGIIKWSKIISKINILLHQENLRRNQNF